MSELRAAHAVPGRRGRSPGCRWVAADLADPAASACLAEQVGRLDAVAHAARLQFSAPLGGLGHGHGELMWRLHVDVPTRLLDALVDRLSHGARVVLIGSRTRGGVAGKSRYAATRSARAGLARSWAIELAPRRITVNVLAPGPTATAMLSDPNRAATPPRLLALGRFVAPAEVAGLTDDLLGAEAGSFIGQQPVACGGACL